LIDKSLVLGNSLVSGVLKMLMFKLYCFFMGVSMSSLRIPRQLLSVWVCISSFPSKSWVILSNLKELA